ncbi:SDR family NAD(P)-dependent oxidoreductase [Streptacidiphilus jiangxiensis]|uniref:Meso-butanediol dehydrogenase / (S,S)-butanediol dehydrogenase / diacetyl reductase n=1 Tax=Streptacidiphilus jiangxiensis TaxID=235985 RepID=A0A1H7WD44_STRJI|nr:SDR family oxidoreductase [Streptacidiphilus jiangxiensis]SEM18928.1 meso-butanediol dehydrogenase / (S,S)-butanediol dehydrogenase / diacetyl reductase [Streptacidiphilus jiangxiensis]
MDRQFFGRVAVITGAGTGIGAATAHRFAADGYTVVLVGRTEATLKQTAQAGPGAARMHPRVADVSDQEAVAAVMDEAAERFGRLDVLVNNAGVAVPGTVDRIDVDSYRTMLATNIDGVFFASRAALPHLEAVHGCIVNVGSVAGLRGEWHQAAYNMTKSAVVGLTNSMALDHGPRIRVNAVHPGLTLSRPYYRDALAEGSALHRRFVDRVPMGRAGEPAEVAAVIAFLAGPDAAYVNGAHLTVDGGLTASDGQTNLHAVDA